MKCICWFWFGNGISSAPFYCITRQNLLDIEIYITFVFKSNKAYENDKCNIIDLHCIQYNKLYSPYNLSFCHAIGRKHHGPPSRQCSNPTRRNGGQHQHLSRRNTDVLVLAYHPGQGQVVYYPYRRFAYQQHREILQRSYSGKSESNVFYGQSGKKSKALYALRDGLVVYCRNSLVIVFFAFVGRFCEV